MLILFNYPSFLDHNFTSTAEWVDSNESVHKNLRVCWSRLQCRIEVTVLRQWTEAPALRCRFEVATLRCWIEVTVLRHWTEAMALWCRLEDMTLRRQIEVTGQWTGLLQGR